MAAKTGALEPVTLLSPLPTKGATPHLMPPVAPLVLINPLGYAAEEGLDVTIESCGIPSAAIEGVIEGRGDATFVNAVFNFLYRDQGHPFFAFSCYVRHQNRTFVVPETSDATSLQDLKGTTVGLFAIDHLPFARATLMADGIDADTEVKFNVYRHKDSFQADEMVNALKSGEIKSIWLLDVMVGHFPAAGVPVRNLPATLVDTLTPSACLLTTDSRMEERSDVLGRLARAVAKGTVFCQANPVAAVRLVWEHVREARPAPGAEDIAFQRDLFALKARLENQRVDNTRDPRWGLIEDEGMAAWQDFLLETGEIKTRLPLAEHYTNDLVETINDFDPAPVIEQARSYPES